METSLDAPQLGRPPQSLNGFEPALGGTRRTSIELHLIPALLSADEAARQAAVSDILDAGLQRYYALELTSILAVGAQQPGTVKRRYAQEERIAAAKVLEAFGQSVAVEALVELLDDRQWWVAQYAADALLAFGTAAAGATIQALRAHNPIVRRRAATILGHLGSQAAVEPLLAALRVEKAAWAKACIIEGLSRLSSAEEVQGAVSACLGDPDELVRLYAGQAFVRWQGGQT